MLAIRRSLIEHTWDQIIEGCRNYAKFCQESGSEGSSFVQTPQRFIEDASYLEEFTYQEPADPRVADTARRKEQRWERAIRDGETLNPPLHPGKLDSIEAFETRIAMQRNKSPAPASSVDLRSRIANLAERLKS